MHVDRGAGLREDHDANLDLSDAPHRDLGPALTGGFLRFGLDSLLNLLGVAHATPPAMVNARLRLVNHWVQ